jgi:HSP20 family protein
MLMRIDAFRELDHPGPTATWSRPASVPVDVYRTADHLLLAFDLPGVAPDAIDVQVERNLLTIKAERRPFNLPENTRCQHSERALGVFSRQVSLSDALNTADIQATYDNGVLLVTIPVTEPAKPRKVSITTTRGTHDTEDTQDTPQVINA